METVAVLGTGRMGMGLARNFAAIGCAVHIGSRDRARAVEAASEIAATGGTYEEAAAAADIVVITLPFGEVSGLLDSLEASLAGKIVVDITNPFGAAPEGMSGVELHAPLLPPTASLVAAFKTTISTLLDPAERGGDIYDVFVCGEDKPAKDRISALIEAMGFRPVDCGGLESARVLDLMVPLLLQLDQERGNNRRSAWRFLP